jgi:hypothetical protein
MVFSSVNAKLISPNRVKLMMVMNSLALFFFVCCFQIRHALIAMMLSILLPRLLRHSRESHGKVEARFYGFDSLVVVRK